MFYENPGDCSYMEGLCRKLLIDKYIIAFGGNVPSWGPPVLFPSLKWMLICDKILQCGRSSDGGCVSLKVAVILEGGVWIIWGNCGSLDRKMEIRKWKRELLPLSRWFLVCLNFGVFRHYWGRLGEREDAEISELHHINWSCSCPLILSVTS